MRIELAVVGECPHEEAATALLRQALDDIGLGSESFSVKVVETQSAADELNFLGSPSFMVDGRDLFAAAGRPAVACRLYPDGPLPSLRELRRALKEAAAAPVRR